MFILILSEHGIASPGEIVKSLGLLIVGRLLQKHSWTMDQVLTFICQNLCLTQTYSLYVINLTQLSSQKLTYLAK